MSAAIEYARLLRELTEFERRGERETPAAEAVADRMDGPWGRLTETEEGRLRALSADLNDLLDGTTKGVAMTLEQEAAWKAEARPLLMAVLAGAGDPDAVLLLLRKPYPASLPPGTVALWKARCWEALGDPETASAFVRAGSEQSARQLLAAG
ncbi:MAG: hypothetical protein K2W96_19480 [Gemmataceae bacterium]|nr:hypothetical protein [Gemmataceae bacterium]